MNERQFAPGCALMIYKPHLAEKIYDLLVQCFGPMDMFLTCCHHIPPLPAGTKVINICPGCDKRYRENYDNIDTISLWEVIADNPFFNLPDYKNREMTIIDACPTRDQTRVHDAVRDMIQRMNINLVEPNKTRTKSTCCGDSFFQKIPTEQVIEQMKIKASEMPVEDVIVYCVSCSKSMFVGQKQPRYLIDLLFEEETISKTYQPDQWHQQLDEFINSHT